MGTKTAIIIKDLMRNIRSYGSVLFLGAGFSCEAEMPLVEDLKPIIANIYSRYLKDALKKPSNGDIWGTYFRYPHDKGWKAIRACLKAQKDFKKEFTALCQNIGREQRASWILKCVVEGFIYKYFSTIFTLNWDDLIEQEHLRLFRNEIPKRNTDSSSTTVEGFFWKLHGDVGNPRDRWIFPGEGGHVFKCLKTFQPTPSRPVIVIGYSFSDEAINSFISSLGNLVYAVGLHIDEKRFSSISVPYYLLPITTKRFFEYVKSLFDELVLFRDFQILNLGDFRGSEEAFKDVLEGHGIRAEHVVHTCKLGEVNEVSKRLYSRNFATLTGEFGSGKSSIAYHTARDYLKKKVGDKNTLVYVFRGRTPITESYIGKLTQGFRRNQIPALFIFDDFHTYGSRKLYKALFENASDINRILVVRSYSSVIGDVKFPLRSRIDIDINKSSVRLRSFFNAKIKLVVSHLGDPQATVRKRIEKARYSRINAYSFVVIMCNGFMRIKNQIKELRKKRGRYDLILFAVSLHCATIDEKGIGFPLIKKLLIDSLSERQIKSGLCALSQLSDYSRRFVVEGERQKFRIPHVNLSGLILRAFYDEINISEEKEFRKIIEDLYAITFALSSLKEIEEQVQGVANRLYHHKNLWISEYLLRVLKRRHNIRAEFFKQLGFSFHIYGIWSPAEIALRHAARLYSKERNRIEILRCEYWLSFLQFHRGNSESAIRKYSEILNIALRKEKLRDLVPKIHRDLAQIYAWARKTSDLDRALYEARKSVEKDEKYGFQKGWSYCWLGQVHRLRNEYCDALKCLLKGEEEFRKILTKPRAKPFMIIPWEGEPDHNNIRQKFDGLFWINYEKGVLHENRGKFEEAIKQFKKSIKHANRLLNNKGLAHCYLQMGGCCYKLDGLKESYCYFQISRFLFRELRLMEEINAPFKEFPEFRGVDKWIKKLEGDFDYEDHLSTCGYRKCRYQTDCAAS